MLDLAVDISIRRGRVPLHFDLHVKQPVSGIFGASGSGKTTLLHCVGGLLRPDAGHIVLNGRTLYDSASHHFTPPHQRHVGLVFQDAQLFPHLSVRDNLLYGYRHLKASKRRFELETVVELLEIGTLLERRPGQLSGGEKQRVALGRALLYSPQLLLLDEPLAALDGRLKRQILPFLRRVRDVGIPMLYVSHTLDEILYLTPHLALVEAGRIPSHGHYLDVLGSLHNDLADAGALRNLWEVEIIENHATEHYSRANLHGMTLIVPPAPVQPGQSLTVSVRAAQIALARRRIDGITIQNQLLGRIVRRISRHQGWLLEIDAGIGIVAEINGKTVRDLELWEGEEVYCLIKAQSFEFPDQCAAPP